MTQKEYYGQYGMTEDGLYKNRYQAKKHKLYDEVTVKVEGGYKNMRWDEYQIWKSQK